MSTPARQLAVAHLRGMLILLGVAGLENLALCLLVPFAAPWPALAGLAWVAEAFFAAAALVMLGLVCRAACRVWAERGSRRMVTTSASWQDGWRR